MSLVILEKDSFAESYRDSISIGITEDLMSEL